MRLKILLISSYSYKKFFGRSRSLTERQFCSSMRNRCLILRHDKLKLFDKAENFNFSISFFLRLVTLTQEGSILHVLVRKFIFMINRMLIHSSTFIRVPTKITAHISDVSFFDMTSLVL